MDRDDDEFGHPWLAIAAGIAFLFMAWYIYSKTGASTKLNGKAGIVNSGFGRTLLVSLMTIVGGYSVFRGVSTLRSK